MTFQEESGIDRQESPVTFGVPLPQGALNDAAATRLLAPGEREVPVQFIVTAFWPSMTV